MVRGTRPYRVYVTREKGGVSISCTCPRFETTPCKHVWATLVALDRDERPGPVGPGRTLPSLPPRARPVAPWQARLDGLASPSSTVARETGTSWPAGREVVYEIDLPATLDGPGARRGPLPSPAPQERNVEPASAAQGGSSPDRGAARPRGSRGPFAAARRPRHRHLLLLRPLRDDGADPLPPPRPARVAGAFRSVRHGTLLPPPPPRSASPCPSPGTTGGAWRFEMSVKAEGGRYVVDGVLRRGGEERTLDASGPRHRERARSDGRPRGALRARRRVRLGGRPPSPPAARGPERRRGETAGGAPVDGAAATGRDAGGAARRGGPPGPEPAPQDHGARRGFRPRGRARGRAVLPVRRRRRAGRSARLGGAGRCPAARLRPRRRGRAGPAGAPAGPGRQAPGLPGAGRTGRGACRRAASARS